MEGTWGNKEQVMMSEKIAYIVATMPSKKTAKCLKFLCRVLVDFVAIGLIMPRTRRFWVPYNNPGPSHFMMTWQDETGVIQKRGLACRRLERFK